MERVKYNGITKASNEWVGTNQASTVTFSYKLRRNRNAL